MTLRVDQVIELRQYTIDAAHRDNTIAMFHSHLTNGQRDAGINVRGVFADANRPDRIVWWRTFPNLATRHDTLRAFYRSKVWANLGETFNTHLLDYSNAMMLQPHHSTSSLDLLETPAPIAVVPADPTEIDTVADDLATQSPNAVILATLDAPNGYPRLPLRSDTNVIVVGGTADIDCEHNAIQPTRVGRTFTSTKT